MKRIFFIIILFILSLNTFGSCVITCYATYTYKEYNQSQQGSGYFTTIGESSYQTVKSNTYTLNITFYSGYEYGYPYNNYDILAVVEWDNGGHSVIKINTWVTNLKYITVEEVLYYTATGQRINYYDGYDQEGRYWEISPI